MVAGEDPLDFCLGGGSGTFCHCLFEALKLAEKTTTYLSHQLQGMSFFSVLSDIAPVFSVENWHCALKNLNTLHPLDSMEVQGSINHGDSKITPLSQETGNLTSSPLRKKPCRLRKKPCRLDLDNKSDHDGKSIRTDKEEAQVEMNCVRQHQSISDKKSVSSGIPFSDVEQTYD